MSQNKYNYRDDKVDKWFEWKGVKPPERQPHLTEEELEAKLAENLQDHKCEWIQRGNAIECDQSSQYTHGKVIGVNVRLAGTDENGKPVLVPIGPILRKDVENA